MIDKVKEIRSKEMEYHKKLYQEYKLFDKGSWLEKPVATVLESFQELEKQECLKVLDIRCGVGRNAIPIAMELKDTNSKIICIDILNIAISKLKENAKQYNVEEYIEAKVSSIEDYEFSKNKYDFVFAVSTLEHIKNHKLFQEIICEISKNTIIGGVNCFILNSSVREYRKIDNMELIPQFEVNLETKSAYNLLDEIYNDWEVMKRFDKHYKFEIMRDELPVILDTHVITYVSMKVE